MEMNEEYFKNGLEKILGFEEFCKNKILIKKLCVLLDTSKPSWKFKEESEITELFAKKEDIVLTAICRGYIEKAYEIKYHETSHKLVRCGTQLDVLNANVFLYAFYCDLFSKQLK